MTEPTHAQDAPWKFHLDSTDGAGRGACGGHRLDDVLARIRQDFPLVADITTFRSSGPRGPALNAGPPVPVGQASVNPMADGTASFVTAYMDDDAFGVVFFRGNHCRGENCGDSEYWYFETAAGCAPKWVGHFHTVQREGGRFGTCFEVDGKALWGWPYTPPARSRCDVDWSAQNISGTRKAMSLDPIGTCMKESVVPIELTIVQGADLSQAILTVAGTGISFIDGQPFSGTVERQSFTAEIDETSSSSCMARRQVSIRLDFEGPSINGIPGGFGLLEITEGPCTADPNDTTGCQASLHLVHVE